MASATTTIEVDGHSIALTSQSKVLFPDDRITKGDLVTYYRDVAPHMLPHTTGRPLTLQCFPGGISGHRFYQKQASEHWPEFIPRVTLVSRDEGETNYALGDNAATLVFLANQNSITFHVCSVRPPKLDRPDLLILDLDPSDDDFEKVREGALLLRPMLTEVGLVPYVKTSGSRGLHVVAPIVASDDHDAVRYFARTLAERLVQLAPDRFTIEIAKKKRGTAVFVDYLRNGSAQTVAAPYTVRALPGAPVATPLHWHELEDPALHARTFTLKNVRDRLQWDGDPWRDMMRDARPLEP